MTGPGLLRTSASFLAMSFTGLPSSRLRAAARLSPLVGSALMLLVGAVAAHGQLAFQGLGDLAGGNVYSFASAVSADGTVVVGYGDSGSGGEAFRWTAGGGMEGLGDIAGGSFSSAAYGVSANGTTVVGSGYVSNSVAFSWTSTGGMANLGYLPGGNFSVAKGASANGAILAGTGNSSTGSSEAFRWTASGGMEGLGYLFGGSVSYGEGISADGSVIVGYSNTAAFRWTESGGMASLGYLPGGNFSWASGTASDGSVVIGYGYSTNGTEGFIWTPDAGMVGLGDLPGGAFSSNATGVSGDGSVIVGTGSSGSFGQEAMFWTQDTGMVSLYSYLTGQGVDLSGWSALTIASAISSDGSTIVGQGVHNGHAEAFLVTGLSFAAVPEPSTYAIAAGLAAIGVGCWRRRAACRGSTR